MRTDYRSFDEFWTAFARAQRPAPFRFRRAGLALARLALQQRRADAWRWALAAAALTAGKLIAGTLEDELAACAADSAPPDDARWLMRADATAPYAPSAVPPLDREWAAWL